MREEIVQKGQWIGLVAGTFFALTGTQKERKIAVCPTTHLQDDVCVTVLLVRIGLLREDQFLCFALIISRSPQKCCAFDPIYQLWSPLVKKLLTGQIRNCPVR